MDRNELLQRIRDSRSELETEIARFDRSTLTDPVLPNGWSVKDVIAHIGFWERRIATLYEILTAGDVPQDTVDSETVDGLNARVHKENQMLPLGIVQVNEKDAYQAILAVAGNAPETDLFDPQCFPWTQGTPFYQYIVENTYEHYDDHLPDLRAALNTND
jgi:hypothetical protein